MKKMPYIMEMLIALVILPLSGFVDDRGGCQQASGQEAVHTPSPKAVDYSHDLPSSLLTAVLLDL